MAGINATLVKTLRDKTGAGVIACKNALAETQGDFDAAVDRLRAAEASKAAQKADRVAAEGLVGVLVEGTRGAVIELNTETDFVARTAGFQDAVTAFARIALEVSGDHEALLAAPAADGDGRVADVIARLTARTGEHVKLRRCGFVSVARGAVASYVHSASAPGLGRIGVLVALESAAPPEALLGIGRKLAMHIAAASPQWIGVDDIPAAVVVEKRAALVEQARTTGKAAEIVDKIVEGRMRRFFQETVLGLQPSVLNPEQRVSDALQEAEAAVSASVVVKAFVRFKTGEGLDAAPRTS
jgi:elongation factor Ts